jgi:predicted DNA-binding ArsR family transcriptional regulator
MQVTLNIESGQLGDTVVDLFKSLDQNQRKEIATQILTEWIRNPDVIESKAEEEKALQYVKNKASSWDISNKSDEELKRLIEYRDYFRKNPSSKQQMIGQVKKEITEFYQAEVHKLVREDPTTRKMVEAVSEIVKDTMPKLVHDAMVLWTAANLDKAINATIGGLMQMTTYDGNGNQVTMPTLNNSVGDKLQKVLDQSRLPIQ